MLARSVLHRLFGPLVITLLIGHSIAPAASTAEPFDLHDGDRVVLLGDTLIERAQTYGYLETELTRRWPDRDVRYRNLGWSGDTVWAESRAGFDTPKEGLARLVSQLEQLKPSVVFLGYGANSAQAGPAGLARFEQGLSHLLDVIQRLGARVVILSPLWHENLGSPWPDPTQDNQHRRLYADRLRAAAVQRDARYLDLAPLTWLAQNEPTPWPLTTNGIHLSPEGYWHFARYVVEQFELPEPDWHVSLDGDGELEEARGTQVELLTANRGELVFRALDAILPPVPPPTGPTQATDADGDRGGADRLSRYATRRVLRVHGLPAGRYRLQIDEHPVLLRTAEEWNRGVTLPLGPEFAQVEALRQAIIEKNTLYFHSYRPQNTTYLFGFRKHEQGQNAGEVARFAQLVDDAERRIAGLRRPKAHVYRLTRIEP